MTATSTTIPMCPLMRLDWKNSCVNAPQCYVISTLLIFLFLTGVLRSVGLVTLRWFEDWVWTANLPRLSVAASASDGD